MIFVFSKQRYLKLCPHPDETQLHILARDLGLEPEQIYHWFQTKIQGDHEVMDDT